MKKNLFFAALAAVTLTAGLTSCSSDDDAKTDGNGYKETYLLKYANDEGDSIACSNVIKAYTNVLGTTNTENIDSISIAGKDSADCMDMFLAKMQKASESLSKATFDTHTYVTAVNRNGSLVYAAKYGPQENDAADRNYVLECDPVIIEKSNDYTYAYAGELSWRKPEFYTSDFYYTPDLNTGCNSECLNTYLIPVGGGGKRPNPITDIIIYDAYQSDNNNVNTEIEYNGIKYSLVYSGTPSKCSLNSGFWSAHYGDEIYFYTTYDPAAGKKLLQEGLFLGYRGHFFKRFWFFESFMSTDFLTEDMRNEPKIKEVLDKAPNRHLEAAPLVATRNGRVVLLDSRANLNEGIGDAIITHLLLIYEYN